MITETDKKTIYEISKNIVLSACCFWAPARIQKESGDIDIGVEGIAAKDFFSYYGDLMLSLSKPVDIIDISGKSKFIKLILKEGIPLYG